jgi:hypothetical protein
MMERGSGDAKTQGGAWWPFIGRIGCHAKRHQKAIASEQEQRISPGEVSIGKCGVSKYSVYKGRYTEDVQNK